MPTEVEFRAREIAKKSGYNPDQLVVDINRERDFDYLAIGVAPVDLSKMYPVYKMFIEAAKKQMSGAWVSL